MFGSSKFTFPSSGFNATTTTTTTSSLFGGGSLFSTPASSAPTTPVVSGAFGTFSTPSFGSISSPFKSSIGSPFSATSGTAATAPFTGTTIKFDPVVSTDNMKKGAVNQKQNVKYMSITVMTQYENKSFEELRVEDYAANRKTANINASTLFRSNLGGATAFGSTPAASTASGTSSWLSKPFGTFSAATPAVSTPATSNIFGSATSKPLFSTETFSFNAPSAATTSASTFSFGSSGTTTQSSIFGKPTGSAFGGVFGAQTTKPTTTVSFSLFGNPTSTATTSATPSFFSNIGSATSSAPSFPAASKPFGSAFGTAPAFGGLFGSSQPSTTQSTTFSFGTAASTASTSSKPFTNLFGQQPLASAGGGSLWTVSSASNQPAGGAFGSQPTAGTHSGLASLLYLTSKEKDPEVAKRSAQMLLRAQCFSYSTDPIFHNYVPGQETPQSKASLHAGTETRKAVAPEPLSHRVRSLLPPSSDPRRRSSKAPEYVSRSVDLKRLVLSPPSSPASPLSRDRPRADSSEPGMDSTLEDYLLNVKRGGKLGAVDTISDPLFSSDYQEGEGMHFNECVRLTRPGYQTCPALHTLHKDPITNSCIVSDFAVYREGYGCITWLGETDVAGIDLDNTVFIRRKEVIVYPDDEAKPPVGEGLNKPAEITLHLVFPVDKLTREQIKEEDKLTEMNYATYLEEATIRMGAQYLDYMPATGSWTFKVEHFTRYGLEYNEPYLDDNSCRVGIRAWQRKLSSKEDIQKTRFSPDACSTVLNEVNNQTRSLRSPEVLRDDKSLSVEDGASKQDESMAFDDTRALDSSACFSRLCIGNYKFIPVRIPWSSSLVNTDRNLSWDRAFFLGGSFRVNLNGPNRVHYYTPATQNWNIVRRYDLSAEYSHDLVNAILTTQFKHRDIMESMDHPFSCITVEDSTDFIQELKSCLLGVSADSANVVQALSEAMTLLSILFSGDDDEPERRARLVHWLKSSIVDTARDGEEEGSTMFRSEDDSPTGAYSQILSHMLRLDRKAAVSKALASKNYRLAQMIAIPPGITSVQNALKCQMVQWCDREADQYIDKTLIQIYMLLSGELLMELSDGTELSLIAHKHWKQNLLIILSYCLLSDTPCERGITLLSNLIGSELCSADDDIVLQVLKFCVDPATANIAELLETNRLFELDDYTTSWCLLQAIQCLNIKRVDRDFHDRLCVEFARQLEGSGMWNWASFVLAHVKEPKLRLLLCEEVLIRNVSESHDLNNVELWLCKELEWCPRAVHFAKSVKARSLHNWFLCCDHLIQADRLDSALTVLFDRLLPLAFDQEDRSELVHLLQVIECHVEMRDEPVDGWVESGRFLRTFFTAQDMFTRVEADSEQATLDFAEAAGKHFEFMAGRIVEVSKEARIHPSILHLLCEGIRSSMGLLCKWLSGYVRGRESDKTERIMNVLRQKETVCKHIDALQQIVV